MAMATSAVMRTGAATPSGTTARAARGTVGTGDGTAHSTGAATWRRNSRRGKTIPGGATGVHPNGGTATTAMATHRNVAANAAITSRRRHGSKPSQGASNTSLPLRPSVNNFITPGERNHHHHRSRGVAPLNVISDSRTDTSSTSTSTSTSMEYGSASNLVEVDRPRGNSTTAQAMANSVNILLGVGLLSVPYALQQGGWAGLGVLGILGVTTNYTGKILIRCQRRGSLPAIGDHQTRCDVNDSGGTGAVSRGIDAGADDSGAESVSCDWDDPHEATRRPLLSYEDVGEAAFGDFGRGFITWVLYTELVGTCALFFILEGDHLEILFQHAHSQEWFMCAAAAVMIPTLWLADLSSLSYVGALGALASLSLMGVVMYELVAVGGFPGTIPPGFESTALLHLSTLPVSFGLLAFVFAGHAVFPAIYTSMAQPEEYEGMLNKTYAIVGLTCLLIGGAGYGLYGDAVADEVTLNLPAGAASTLALGLVTVNPFSKFALTMDPVSRGLEKAAGIDIGNKGGDALKARAVRTGLGAGALLTAAKVPFFAVFMSLIGSFLTLTVSVIFPSACYLKMFEDELTGRERVANWSIMLLGGFCVVAGSSSAIGAAMDQF